jgi:hypothetical protein
MWSKRDERETPKPKTPHLFSKETFTAESQPPPIVQEITHKTSCLLTMMVSVRT